MYERFYQLRERPFALSPDPEYLYPSRVHQEALDYLRYGRLDAVAPDENRRSMCLGHAGLSLGQYPI